jgi:hypothetical protein
MLDELLPGDTAVHTASGRHMVVLQLGTKWQVPAAWVRPIPKLGVEIFDNGEPRAFWVPRAVLRRLDHAS